MMLNLVFLFSLPGGMEWILIFLAVLLLFGGRKIPELMKGLGRGIREFNDAREKVKNELEEGIDDSESKQKSSGKSDAENSKEKPRSDSDNKASNS